MRTMPNPPRTEGLAHEEAAVALQRWLWACAAAGWDVTRPDHTRWSHDDNMEAMQLGWMISQPPNSPYLDLFSLRGGEKPHDVMDKIIKMAPVSMICAKAVCTLSAQKMMHPNVRFAFDGYLTTNKGVPT